MTTNPLVRTFAGLVHYQFITIESVPEHLRVEVAALVATYGEPYVGEHIHRIEQITNLQNILNTIPLKVSELIQDVGVTGPKGDPGEPGEPGEPFLYSDFTPAQLESLKVKGDKGDKGDRGESSVQSVNGVSPDGNGNVAIPTAGTASLGLVRTGVATTSNINNASGSISVADATTAAKGVVQLNSTLTSTSTSLAATPSTVKTLNDNQVAHAGTLDIHRKITVSTADPSGGANGDIWIKY